MGWGFNFKIADLHFALFLTHLLYFSRTILTVIFRFIFIIFVNRILIKGIQKSTILMVLNAEEFSCDLNFESNVFKVNLAI
jgi:hypothetical protein